MLGELLRDLARSAGGSGLDAMGSRALDAPLRAIAVPRISGTVETTYQPINGGQALAALAPSTMIQLPGTGPATMAALSGAARAVPCFRLDVGTDPAGVPAALERILGSAS